MRKNITMPDIDRVGPGNTATLEVPIGYTYERIIFRNTGTGLAISDIEQIEVKLNGKTVQTYNDLQRLIDINTFYGRGADSANEFVLHFFRGELHDLGYQRAPGIGTRDVANFTVKIKIAAGAPADIAMEADARVGENQDLGVFCKVYEFPKGAAVAGYMDIDKLPKGPLYSALHFFKSDVSRISIKVDDVDVYDDTDKAVLERDQKEASPRARTPITARATHVDFILDGDLAQGVDTSEIGNWRIKPYLDTSGDLDLVVELYDTLKEAA